MGQEQITFIFVTHFNEIVSMLFFTETMRRQNDATIALPPSVECFLPLIRIFKNKSLSH